MAGGAIDLLASELGLGFVIVFVEQWWDGNGDGALLSNVHTMESSGGATTNYEGQRAS
jgi:hypothetical protein